jgi:hypothetical protein
MGEAVRILEWSWRIKAGAIRRRNRVAAVNGMWMGNARCAEAPMDRIGANFPQQDSAEASCLDLENANG